MIKKKISIIFMLFICSFPMSAQAFIEGILSPPCGCGWFQAGRDATVATRDDKAGQRKFQHCLECREIKEFSDIAPYLRSFINQLPEEKYPNYIQLLKTVRWVHNPNQSYKNVILENAEPTWHYTVPTTRDALPMDENGANDGKKVRGSYKQLWKFLYQLSRDKKPS
jgi:hypothetical protein